MTEEIKYELHDSLIYKATSGPRHEICLFIKPYEVYYPELKDILVRFGGIDNYPECEKIVQALNKELLADREFAWRIETFKIDDKRPSKMGNLFFYLEIEFLKGITIHCSKINWKVKLI